MMFSNKHAKKVWLAGLAILFFMVHCKKEPPLPQVASVGERPILVDEFKDVYRFNPYLARIKSDTLAKRAVLHALLAEKALACRAAEQGLHHKPAMRQMIEQFKNEALIEKFWQDSIFSKIKLSEEELKKAFILSQEKRIIDYLIFPDSVSASRVYRQLQQGGKWENFTYASDTITFRSPLPSIREAVFAMSSGETHPPIKEGGYYFVLRLKSVRKNIALSAMDYQRQKPSLIKLLKKRKSWDYFRSYVKNHLSGAPYHVNTEVLKKVVRQMENRLFAGGKSQLDSMAIWEVQPDLQQQTAVRFENGPTWSVKQLLQKLRVAPYPLKKSSPAKFRTSFLVATRQLLDDQLIIDWAKKAGMENTPYVKTQTIMWRDYLLAQMEFARFMREHGSLSAQEKKKRYYALLKQLFTQYPPSVNSQVLDTLRVARSDMFVFKTHFPIRSIAPVLEPQLLPDSLWQNARP